MTEVFDDPRWDTFGLLKEAYLAVAAAMAKDLAPLRSSAVRPELRDILIRLARSPQHQQRPSELTRSLSTTPSSMTRLLDEGEAAGALVREPDPDDRRASLVTLTDSGLAMTETWAKANLESSVSHTSAHLAPAEVEQLEKLLRTLRDNAQRHLEDQTESG